MSCLNPLLTVGFQVRECVRLHQAHLGRREAKDLVVEIFRKLRLNQPEKLVHCYPHQLSGGMQQRIAIAMAICNQPQLIIADEPTTALDRSSQRTVLELLKELQQIHKFALLFITHDLWSVQEMADRVALMFHGKIIELATKKEFFSHPQHHYARKLIDSMVPLPSSLGSQW
jgi:ABC-type dipeptide/oligopeptide/nickel transport system ATPase component